MDLYYVCVLGRNQSSPLWNKPNLIVEYIENVCDMRGECMYDCVFITTPVEWLPDGVYNSEELKKDVLVVKELGYEIILTATLPIGVAGELGCHYLPIQQHYVSYFATSMLFGCCDKVLVNKEMMYHLSRILFESKNISFYYTEAVEMIFLITLCQNYINHSFYKEMSHFCSKNKVKIDFQSISWMLYHDMTPILVYMIQQMEDAKLDCPILYSCLFRQNYIDIHI